MEDMAVEEWRTIPGFENYSVSNMGRVRRDVGGKGARAGTLLRPARDNMGRLSVALSCNGIACTKRVHRLVMLAFRGECPIGNQVAHNNGDPSDNRIQNLRYTTQQDNNLDIHRHGRRFGRQLLEMAQAVEIMCRLDAGETVRGLAREYGVSKMVIGHIKHGRAWAHLRTRSKGAA